MVSNLGALILFFVLRYLALIFESPAIALLGYFLAVLLVLSVFWQIIMFRKVKVKMHFPFPMLEKKYEASIHLRLENGRPFKLRKVSFLAAYHREGARKKHKKWLSVSLVPEGESDYQFAFSIEEAGNFCFRLKRIRIYDVFGILYQDYPVKAQEQVLVLPTIREIPITLGQRVTQFFGDSDLYDRERPGPDPSEVFDVREFRDGDRLPSIHWKISAKMDQLMIKENSLPKACPIILCFNEAGDGQEESLEIGISISFSLMTQKCPHYVVWQSRFTQDLDRIRVEDEETFYEAVMEYLQDRALSRKEGMVQRYKEKYRGEQYVHDLLLEGGKVLLDGETVEEGEGLSLLLR